ncbi:uncharacterized protein F5891DRAFT_1084400 [Suillus fuscotomentosus]|uniref:Uncharacterized protein n=1 Tax=Suillus fuscotomentosus TaxID=1912939 RepID=A0AAD4DND2_9AGAM|nr:uncharacterized protein F5891DRAFT_1084400 [Suillus fuscotomentosus]KAG1886329.1 hypothetical protein F5891DRAFT_1084400 [Suillus fuscotomentosus]
MRFSSAAIVLAVITALVSSTSAIPVTGDEASADKCCPWCIHDSQCQSNLCCIQLLFICTVSRVFAFTSVQYGS